MRSETTGIGSRPTAAPSNCDCDREARTADIEPHLARERGFEELEVIHFPEYRSIIYRCVRCGKRFEGWHEGGGFAFIPVLEKERPS